MTDYNKVFEYVSLLPEGHKVVLQEIRLIEILQLYLHMQDSGYPSPVDMMKIKNETELNGS